MTRLVKNLKAICKWKLMNESREVLATWFQNKEWRRKKREIHSPLWWAMRWRCSLAACLCAAAIGHPERLLCELLLLFTCPLPLHPGVGHFRIVSCIARTKNNSILLTPVLFSSARIHAKSLLTLRRYFVLPRAPRQTEINNKYILFTPLIVAGILDSYINQC